MASRRRLLSSLLIGTLHALGLLLVAVDLGYSVGPSNYSVLGLGWRYGGLIVVAAVPVWLAFRYRLVAPLVALDDHRPTAYPADYEYAEALD